MPSEDLHCAVVEGATGTERHIDLPRYADSATGTRFQIQVDLEDIQHYIPSTA